jgi:hypothetical protein
MEDLVHFKCSLPKGYTGNDHDVIGYCLVKKSDFNKYGEVCAAMQGIPKGVAETLEEAEMFFRLDLSFKSVGINI